MQKIKLLSMFSNPLHTLKTFHLQTIWKWIFKSFPFLKSGQTWKFWKPSSRKTLMASKRVRRRHKCFASEIWGAFWDSAQLNNKQERRHFIWHTENIQNEVREINFICRLHFKTREVIYQKNERRKKKTFLTPRLQFKLKQINEKKCGKPVVGLKESSS